MEPSLIEYPSDFPLKIFGKSQHDFAQAVLEIVLRHAPDFDAATMEMRNSSANRYLSLTCTIRATSREQLDALYQELHGHPMVVMVL
jgi:putative lipoic acid-binding regulatory protein